jgi:protein-tyrosine phosphatase
MRSVLIVCTANRCRSPLAASFLRRYLTGKGYNWDVNSAGTWTVPGVSALPSIQAVAIKWGENLAEHRTQEISRSLCLLQDLILVMEQGQKEALRYEFPEAAERIFLLSELSGRPYDVADPTGKTATDYETTAVELDRLLFLGLTKIVQLAGESA